MHDLSDPYAWGSAKWMRKCVKFFGSPVVIVNGTKNIGSLHTNTQ